MGDSEERDGCTKPNGVQKDDVPSSLESEKGREEAEGEEDEEDQALSSRLMAGTDEDEISGASLAHVIKGTMWAWRRSFRTAKNKIIRFLWPGSVFSLGVTVAGINAIRLYDVTVFQPVASKLMVLEAHLPFRTYMAPTSVTLCAGTLTGLALFMITTLSRRLLLRQVLNYRAWMYETGKKQSKLTFLWGLTVKLLAGWSPSLYSYQGCLPRMPVPSLKESVKSLIDSLEPIYAHDPEKLEEFKTEAKEFEDTVGPKLQKALLLRSWWADNFVSDWWIKYVYLMGRSPLPINSNYYIMDQGYWVPTSKPCARAAGVLYQLLCVRELILTEELDPLVIRNTIPVCMDQYQYMFSTTRIPGEEIDTLVNYPPSKSQHIVVNRLGIFYKLDITDKYGRVISPSTLEQQLEWIMEDAKYRVESLSENERLVPVLTSQERTTWARVRQEYFSTGVNKETLEWIESAVLVIVLDTHSFPDLSSRASYLLHGEAGSYWFDKSVELVVMSDGHMGLNCEHSFADAPVVAHVMEFNLTYDVISKLYEDDGHCIDVGGYKTPAYDLRSKPIPLQWEVNEGLADCIARAESNAQKSIDDLDLVLFDHREFGKGAMKKCRVSPDAFIQMSLHTTYRKMYSVPALTYEASMTRLFKCGRTETVRSMTKEANAFVECYLDKDTSMAEKSKMLREACSRHAIMYKDAMNGLGLDRHLFALYVASRGLGIDCSFLKKVLSIPWTLSTSQQPQQQIPWSPSCNDPKFYMQLCPGGGFGPVAEDGYGVSYMVPGENRVFFHVSSRKSAPNTSSAKFVDTLSETLHDMKDLFC